eukprot:CAMPEP_0196796178 /NCGR_PEP_ID=MMETSP1104-20130614/37165_1 /TAXON_ID=33652 /ORGANISM="Cafeteria sp., Strain Caron Lab Isolate" /LENGTH=55 /DNA_ID=CAMNT_0042166571 /DNA_START=199 /DNA_END=363 /DNA_ORIENTATION=+
MAALDGQSATSSITFGSSATRWLAAPMKDAQALPSESHVPPESDPLVGLTYRWIA